MWSEAAQSLVPVRIQEILLVSSAYDAFVLEEDGALTDRLFTEYGEIFDNLSTVATVYTSPQASEELFDAFDYTETNVECMDCDNFGFQLGPVTSRVDLSAYAGQRVFVKIEVNSLFFIGYERHALLVDNSPLVAP